MIPDKITDNRVYNAITKRRLLVAVLALSLLSGPALAQVSGSFNDDFENGDIDGWEADDNSYVQHDTTSTNGNGSLYAETSAGDVRWNTGPVLDLESKFTISGTIKPDTIDIQQNRQIFLGISSTDTQAQGENVFLIFDSYLSETYLGTYQDAQPQSDSIQDDFNNEWVRFEIQSESNNGTIDAKVWRTGNAKPTQPQLTRNFNGTSGRFGLRVGTTAKREAYLDDVTIDGTTVPTSDLLSIDAKRYMERGETQEYKVIEEVNKTGQMNTRKDVTDSADIVSSNSSLVEVKQSTNELVATSDEKNSGKALITANYNDKVTIKQVTVADVSVDNIAILPPWRRTQAMITDRTIQIILVSTFMGIIATRVSSAFGGIAAIQLTITGGWFIGWVSIGMALISLFMSLFVGLNLAANIDYTVRR